MTLFAYSLFFIIVQEKSFRATFEQAYCLLKQSMQLITTWERINNFLYSPQGWKENNKVSSSGFVQFTSVLSFFFYKMKVSRCCGLSAKDVFLCSNISVHTWPVLKRGTQTVPMCCFSYETSNQGKGAPRSTAPKSESERRTTNSKVN